MRTIKTWKKLKEHIDMELRLLENLELEYKGSKKGTIYIKRFSAHEKKLKALKLELDRIGKIDIYVYDVYIDHDIKEFMIPKNCFNDEADIWEILRFKYPNSEIKGLSLERIITTGKLQKI